LKSWGWGVRCEAAGIPDDTTALLFALDSLCGLMPRAVASLLLQPLTSLIGDGAPFSKESTTTTIVDAAMRRPRALGIACAIGAVLLGNAIGRSPVRRCAVSGSTPAR
jgi:hypothetical protein